MSRPDRIVLRRQIEFFKKQLQRYCSSSAVTLTDYHVQSDKCNFEHLDEEELESLRLERNCTRSSLLTAYSKITKLHDEWTHLQLSEAGEQKIFEDCVSKYGVYRESMNAVN